MLNLQELEARLQTLIEINLLSLLPGKKIEDVIIQKLALAIQRNTENAPDVYTLIMHPQMAEQWQEQKLLSALLQSITAVAHEAGLSFLASPTITISASENFPINDVEVVASHRVEAMAETNANQIASESSANDENGTMPENAFLIVEGVKVFPLTINVINIGRKLDNQLVIDDPRVSRNHAQLRSIKGRFVVFDLNSTGGTFVNGQRTSQSVLYPGDVISLAGVALIFGQDNPPPRPDLRDTGPLSNAATDRPTAIIKDHSTAKLNKNKT